MSAYPGGTQSVNIEFDMTRSELRRLLLGYVARERSYRTLFLLCAVVITVGAAIGSSFLLDLGIGASIGLLIAITGTCLTAARRNPSLLKSLRLRFSASGVDLESEEGNAQTKWTLYRRIVISRRAIYLRHRGRGVVLVPRRVLAPAEEEILLTLMRERVQQD